jgi:hypothetical protein
LSAINPRFRPAQSLGRMGLDCTPDGVSLAGVPLLRRTIGGLEARDPDEIRTLTKIAFGDIGEPIDIKAGLDVIAGALNRDDLGRAKVAAVQLPLPELSPEAAARIAKAGEELAKFNADQPRDEHGRWTDGAADPGDTASSGAELGSDASAPAGLLPVADKTYAHVSPARVQYSTRTALDSGQVKILNAIVDYGKANGYDPSVITIAANQAFYESALGRIRSNPTNSSVTGLFQYNKPTWEAMRHSGLNINSDQDQIKAMYLDIMNYYWRYLNRQASGKIPPTISFPNYIEIKHHSGPNDEHWNSPHVAAYESTSATLGFQIGASPAPSQPFGINI